VSAARYPSGRLPQARAARYLAICRTCVRRVVARSARRAHDVAPHRPDPTGGRDAKDADDDACYSFAYSIFDKILGVAPPTVTNKVGWKKMACAAIDCSAGQCEAFCSRGNDEVLLYLAERSSVVSVSRTTTFFHPVRYGYRL
jgi:hypothetical protein